MINVHENIKSLSKIIDTANETLQVCVRELQLAEQSKMELAENPEKMLHVEQKLRWVKIKDALPTENGEYVFMQTDGYPCILTIFNAKELNFDADCFVAWFKLPPYKD